MYKLENRGGRRLGAGRKPKADELKLVEKLDNVIDNEIALKKLGELIAKGDIRAIQIYFNYRYGKPKEKIDINSSEGLNISFKDLIRFKYDQSSKKLIEVNGDIQDLESIIFLMKLVQSSELINFKIDRIDYSLITGWDVITDSTLIRFGKDISKKRVKIFGDTLNYLYDNGKIPSIIDMRYKDGVALDYGK